MLRLTLLILLIHLFGPVHGQLEADIALDSDFDTLYIKSYTDQLAVKFYGVTKKQ